MIMFGSGFLTWRIICKHYWIVNPLEIKGFVPPVGETVYTDAHCVLDVLFFAHFAVGINIPNILFIG